MKKKQEIYKVKAFMNAYGSKVRQDKELIYAWAVLDACDNFKLIRNENLLIDWIFSLIDKKNADVPVIIVYDLCKTLYPSIEKLSKKCELKLIASNSVNWFALDVLAEQGKVRFFDCKNLLNDLSFAYDFLGETRYDFDFSITKTTKTSISLDEQKGMFFDCAIIKEFLTRLTQDFDFINFDDFGSKIFTYPSIARQFAKKIAGEREFSFKSGKKSNYLQDYYKICQREKFKSYDEYAYAKSCFRGGLSIINPNFVQQKIENVQKIDVCSCYHAFLTGKRYPVKFEKWENDDLFFACEYIKKLDKKYILSHYSEPFNYYFNAKIKFKNLKFKSSLPFGLLTAEKFQNTTSSVDFSSRAGKEKIENSIRKNGFRDCASNPVFGFSKLMEADECSLFLTEIDFWLICQLYDFEKYEVEGGFCTQKTYKPHGYIVLQSLHFFNKKEELKELAKNDPLAEETLQLFKQMYNSVYGVQVQDSIQTEYIFNKSFVDFEIDEKTIPNRENFDEINKGTFYKSIFNLGSRVSANSRLHLVLAILLIQEKFNKKVDVVGGDTDSLCIRTDYDILAADIIKSLKPLHLATSKAIFMTCRRIFQTNKDINFRYFLKKVGRFEVERENIPFHFEIMNKIKLDIDLENKSVDLTCAGVPQPDNLFNYADFILSILEKYDANEGNIESFINEIIGYNISLPYDLCYLTYQNVPLFTEVFDSNVYDFLGNLNKIENEHLTIAEIKNYITLGDTSRITAKTNLNFLEKYYNKNPRTDERIIRRNGVFSIDGKQIL